jgi:hypothetical protein
MTYIKIFFIMVMSWALAGCEWINPSEPVPAYLFVPDLPVQTNLAAEGSSSARITDVWLTVNGNFLGVYSLPALIPVLEQGIAEVTLEAGIKDNGIAARPEIYPFYAPVSLEVELQPERIDTIRPVVRYRDGIRFAFIEDFEKIPHLFGEVFQGGEGNRIELERVGAFEGNFSGKLQLDKEHPIVEIATSEHFEGLSDRGFQIYLELNYRSEAPVVFGVVGRNQNDPGAEFVYYDPGFLPKEEWNKIYFNLSLLVLDNPFDEYRISLQAFLPADNGAAVSDNATVWLDNIKLIHF